MFFSLTDYGCSSFFDPKLNVEFIIVLDWFLLLANPYVTLLFTMLTDGDDGCNDVPPLGHAAFPSRMLLDFNLMELFIASLLGESI